LENKKWNNSIFEVALIVWFWFLYQYLTTGCIKVANALPICGETFGARLLLVFYFILLIGEFFFKARVYFRKKRDK
jgi:hypothetical protein